MHFKTGDDLFQFSLPSKYKLQSLAEYNYYRLTDELTVLKLRQNKKKYFFMFSSFLIPISVENKYFLFILL